MKNRYFSTHESNGNFIWCGKEILNVTGYSNKELVGKNPYDYTPEEDETRILKKHLAGIGAFDEEKNQDLKCRWIKKDGTKVWLQVYFTKYNDGLICLSIKMKWWEILKFKIILFFEAKNKKNLIIEI